MLIVISPAKTLDFETASPTGRHSQLQFLDESAKLVSQLKKLSPAEISGLMHISDKLGALNYQRYQDWSDKMTKSNAKQALFSFKGDVYSGLNAEQFSDADIRFAQKHLRILSGLYGVIRPLDLIKAYRLEMGTPFKQKGSKDLYAFWGDKISEAIAADMKAIKTDVLLNLASNEYFKSVNNKALDSTTITPVFKDYKNGKYKIISFFAKKARGLMSAWIIQNKILEPEKIHKFRLDGYQYSKLDSTENSPVFHRQQG